MEDKFKLLLNASSELMRMKSVKAIIIKLTDITKRLLKADRCSLFLHDKEALELWTFVANGVKEIRIPDNVGFAGYVYQTAEVVNIDDVYNDARFDREIDQKTGYRTKTMLCVPLHNSKREVMGVFQVINKLDDTPYSKEDIDLLMHLTLYASATLENAMLYEKIKKVNEDIVYRLSNATKFKDPETEKHIVRVGLYCMVLGKYLGWDEEEIDMIKLATPMHDIGKVGIPDNILLKPGKLTDEEWVIMRKHASYGYEILKNSDSKLLQVASIASLQHHEKWNGKGYPSGKKGNEISIYGRMTALADVFDALTSRRPYKDAWSFEDAVKIIKEERGEHFDPQLVDIFLEHLDEFIDIKTKYKDEETEHSL